MLVLNRTLGETIMIDDHTSITVFAVGGDSVRLAINAPVDIKVFREEVYERLRNKEDESPSP